MTEALKVGVAGVGHLGRHHLRLWKSLPGVSVAGIVDVDAARARAMADEFGVPVLPDLDALAASARAVSVAVPTIDHAAVACALLDRGVAVLVEKPMAPDLVQADRILASARGSRATLMVGHTERFNPAFTALQQRVVRPLFIEIHRLGSFSARSLDIDVVLDLMIHDLDVVASLVRGEVESIDATGVEALTDKIDIANARLRFSNGAVANLTASRISVDRVRKLRLFEPNAYASLDYAAQSLRTYTLVQDSGGRPRIEDQEVNVPKDEPLRREIAAFRDAVLGVGPVTVTGEQGRRALGLALEVVEHIRASRPAV